MDTQDLINGLIGGGLIGLAAGGLLMLEGRIAGISGIFGGVLGGLLPGRKTPGQATGAMNSELMWRLLFVLGMVTGGMILYFTHPVSLPVDYEAASGLGVVALGGLLVGFGTRLASGCTSGHGICGVARLSPRSLVATPLFVLAGMLAVSVVAPLIGG